MDILIHSVKRPFWIRLLPLIEGDYFKWTYSRILKARNEADVWESWQSQGFNVRIIRQVLEVVSQECSWPNSLFVPDDECAIVFWPRDIDLGDVNAILALQQKKLLPAEFNYSHVANETLGSFIRREVPLAVW